MKREIFKFIYNKIRYSEYTRIYKKLIKEFYLFNIFIKLYKFI